MMKRWGFILLAASTLVAQAQDPFEDFKKKAMSNFGAFADKAQKDFDNFRDKANAEFAKFMEKPWIKAEVKPAEPVPQKPDPVEPPVKVNPDEKTPPKEIPYERIIPLPEKKPAPQPVEPIPVAPPKPAEVTFSFAYYNTPCKVRLADSQRFTLSAVNEKAVAQAWEQLSKSEYNALISDCLALRSSMTMCDWAYIKFLQQLSESFLGANRPNEAVVMQMYLLTQSGYKVRIARAGNKLVLLVPSDYDIFRYKFLRLEDGVKYYIIDKSASGDFFVFDQAFPKEQLLSIRIDQEPKLAVTPAPRRKLASKRYPAVAAEVQTNKNLIDFYDSYPLNSNWDAFSRASISPEVKEALYPVLKKAIAGRSETDAANVLINFVQTAFEYKTDGDHFGYERPLFADETIFYPFSDCEDRSIFYSILVRELLGLDVVLLHYPGHLATAVKFNSDVRGDFLMIEGVKYTVCDPTYIGASIGEAMPQYKKSSCNVICI